MQIEMYEANGEMWLIVSSDQLLDLPRVLAAMTDEDRQALAAYDPQPVDYKPFYEPEPGFHNTDGWAFAKRSA